MLALSLQERLFTVTPRLETPRLVLRALSLDDAEGLLRVCSDPLVARHQDWEPFTQLSEAQQFISERLELFRRRVRVSWGVALEPSGPLIGQVGLHSISVRDRRAELAFDLRSDYWRRGLMSEALSAVMTFALDRCQLDKLVARTVTANRACHELLLKLGFALEGRLAAHYRWKDTVHDALLFGLTRPTRPAR